MTTFPQLDLATHMSRLTPPDRPVRMVLDTDTYNEIDDQFALAQALLAPERLTVEAIYAAPFFNDRSSSAGDGMEKSYEEILRLLDLLGHSPEGLVYRGATSFLDKDNLVRTEAVDDLINRALASPADDPLYVVAIAALTNIATALLLEPRIIEHIVVVWLGGHALNWPHTLEFNLKQDIPSAQVLFDCGVPLLLVPCMGVTTQLSTTIPELEAYLGGQNPLCDFLVDTVKGYHDDHFAWSKPIWDVAAIAWLLDGAWLDSELVHSPIVTNQGTWSVDRRRHLIRSASFIHRDPIFRDLFTRLRSL